MVADRSAAHALLGSPDVDEVVSDDPRTRRLTDLAIHDFLPNLWKDWDPDLSPRYTSLLLH
jgi:hypothetical protein